MKGKGLAIVSVVLMLAGLSAGSHASEQKGLQLELTPYVWFAGVDGEIAARGQSANFDKSFSDLVDSVDLAYMGMGVISYNRFVLYGDYVDFNLEDDTHTKNGAIVPIGTKVKGQLDTTIGTIAGGYRFDTFGEHSTIDVLVGSRTLSLEEEIKILNVNFQNNLSATDTIVMLRPSFQLAEKWRFNPTMSLAVSGDSDDMYELAPQIQWDFSKYFAMRFGYKKLHYKLSDGSKNTPDYQEFDGDLQGLFVGVGWVFPGRAEKVVAAAPPPPPAPVVAAPKDSDGDGVMDPSDRCPGTPRGTKVDSSGCPIPVPVPVSFDLTVEFAFNSAEINDLSFRELRNAMTFMREHPTTDALVEGNTDSVGGEEYNQKLSVRRADAVLEVLVKSGIDAARISTVGYGETRPVAPNDSEAGRAKNRRVSIVVADKK